MKGRTNLFHGEQVREIIRVNGLTIAEVASKAGMQAPMLSTYLNGRRNPKRCQVQRIADALHVSINEISGYDKETAVPSVVEKITDSNELLTDVCRFVVTELSRQVQMTSQLSVSKKIGISHSQVSNIIHGDADVHKFPLDALIRLCPQIIDRNALQTVGNNNTDELSVVVANIKRLADEITDLSEAKTVETMLKGLVRNDTRRENETDSRHNG